MPKTAKLDSFSDRLVRLLDESGLSPTQLGAAVGASESAARKWFSGATVPGADFVAPIVRAARGGRTVRAALWFVCFGSEA